MANCLTGARELFLDPIWRNRAIGIIVSATTFAFVLGMPLATQIEAHFGWRLAMGSIAGTGRAAPGRHVCLTAESRASHRRPCALIHWQRSELSCAMEERGRSSSSWD
jgi:MFS family permease